jgi:dihydrofolate synthase/folylpolyglutamate synthase
MNYRETLYYLFSQLPMYQRVGKAAYKANLDNTLALDKHFIHPHRLFKTIHVAGTNGKGSISHMLASVLMEAGYRVGLYTSPHLRDFRERIRVNGEMISEQQVVDFVDHNKAVFESVKPSFFEMTVAMAFQHFADEKVDIAVVEVGLGGRLDSTNIITPEISIITNIGLDHTDLLGDSLQAIALEKAGIIKPNTPLIVSETQDEVRHLFQKRCKELSAPLTFADNVYKVVPKENNDPKFQEFTVNRKGFPNIETYSIDLLGKYQAKNLAGVLSTIDQLNIKDLTISPHHIALGLKKVISNTSLMGRWQILGHSPQIICDTGHNAEGIQQVVEQILATPYRWLHMVFGMVGDKDVRRVMALLPKKAKYYFTRASIPRAMDEVQLATIASEFGLHGKTYRNVAEALLAAKENASSDDLIFIGGSTFVVADALA